MTHRNAFRWIGLGCPVALLFICSGPAESQQHQTGLSITKTCPVFASAGETVTCTVSIENQDPDHGVKNLSVTNQVPFPGGPTATVSGCAATLAANDGNVGAGSDFTSCSFQETLNQPCPGSSIVVTDRVTAEGLDSDTGDFANLPVSASATNSIIVSCVERQTTPATPAPAASQLGIAFLGLALAVGGMLKLRASRRGN